MKSILLWIMASANLFAQDSSYAWIRQLGGSADDAAIGVAVDPAGNTYVAGTTNSPDFPVRNAVQSLPGSAPLYRMAAPEAAAKLYPPGTALIVWTTISPCDPRTVYALTPTSVLRSADQGATWTTGLLPTGITPNSITAVCDQPSAPAVFVASTQGLLRSRDLSTWEAVATGGWQRLWADPNVPSTLYARGPDGLDRSLDGGSHWQSAAVTIYDLNFDPGHPGTLYAPLIQYAPGSAIAIQAIVPAKSTDFGATWTPLGPLPGRDNYPQDVVPDPTRPGVLYALGYGFFVSIDSGQTWTAKPLSVGPPLAVDGGTIWAVSNGAVVTTRDGFQTLTPMTSAGLPFLTSLAVRGGTAFASVISTHDLFIAKLSPAGDLLFSTYFGGSHEEIPRSIAVGPDGSVFVAGSTASLDFPTTAGALQPSVQYQGGQFLVKLNPDGTLAYSTYFAGGAEPYNTTANTVAVDVQGAAILAGTTSGGIPITPGAYQIKFDGVYLGGPGSLVPLPAPTNAFVSKLRPDGAALVFSTYLGSQTDTGNAMALAGDGSVFIGGNSHLFNLSADGSKLLDAASANGSAVTAIGLNHAGSVFTLSASQGYQQVNRLNAHLGFDVSVFLPRTNRVALSFDPSDNLLLAGAATTLLPTISSLQGPFAPNTGFVSLVAGDLSSTLFSTFAGDRHLFSAANAQISPEGAIVFAGSTQPSSPFASFYPFPPGPNDAASSDVFVAKLQPHVPALRIDSVLNAASGIANPLAAKEAIAVHGWGSATIRICCSTASLPPYSRTPWTA